jgi:hypothetical protein
MSHIDNCQTVGLFHTKSGQASYQLITRDASADVICKLFIQIMSPFANLPVEVFLIHYGEVKLKMSPNTASV